MDNPGYDWAVINENNSQYLGLLALGFANKLMPDSIYKSIMTHQPYFTSNDGTGFYSRLESYLTSKADNPKIDIQKELYARNLVLTNEERTVLDSIDVLESDKESSENKKLLTRLYTKRYKLFKKQIDIVRDHHGIAAIERSCKAPKCDILKLRFLETSKDRFREIYPVLAKTMQPGWAKNYVQKQLNESIAKQKSIDALFTSGKTHASDNYYIGRPLKQLAFDASLYLLDSIANIDEFILNLKNKFANKALILDFWATWCSPCLTDMPYSKKLHQENKDLPIEYVYLCTSSGSDSEIWKNRIGDLKLRGTHIFMEDELMTALRKKINAEGGYPAYAVIDINGNLSAIRISFMSHLDTESLKSIAGIK
jgi:thiol-disulfide isomerase/thioredoxin